MRKAAAAVLQVDVTTEEEWEELLTQPGLLLVDVYSDWSGPCIAMASTLRKIKFEYGEAIHFAIARNNDIADLERFRGRSEPTWMFLENGKMVNLMFGAHCPKLQKLIVNEIKRSQEAEPSKWQLLVSERAPEEQVRWQEQESIRLLIEEAKRAKEEAEKREKYERYMEHMMIELCEITVMVVYPWVFKDEHGRMRDKMQSPPYTELVQDLFKQCYDVQEELRIQLTEEMIEKMFVESNVEVTEEMIHGLTDGKCMAMRLKGRPPHEDWPVPYPYDAPKLNDMKGPNRQIDDVENYLIHIITKEPFPLLQADPRMPAIRPTYDEPYIERHVYVHEPDPEVEDDVARTHPAVWVPPQARSKVHVFKTLFSAYLEKHHPYEEPAPLLPLCAFKFDATKFDVVRDMYELHSDAIEKFGAFEFDRPPYARRFASTPQDFETKVKYKTGLEVFVVIIRRVTEDSFLAFAGSNPFFVTEDNEVAQQMIFEYFPEGVEDVIPLAPEEKEVLIDDEEEEYYEEMEQEEEEETPVGDTTADFPIF